MLSMTDPRRVLPGQIQLITRRCSERRHFLRPDPEVVQIFRYVLAHACARYGIKLHAFVVMSNHYHLLVTDPFGRMPAFQQYLNSLIARAVNDVWNRSEAFWKTGSYNAVELLEDEIISAKMAYVLLNPVRAGLVAHAADWEGVTSARLDFGQKQVIQRPGFFSKKMPAKVTLELTAPPCAKPRELQAGVALRVEEAERDARQSLGEPLGMKEVLARCWSSSPSSKEQREQSRPQFAGHCLTRRKRAKLEYRQWVGAYREALGRFSDGDRDASFPVGTYRMCVQLHCPIASQIVSD